MVTGAQVVEQARTQLGVPFHHGQATPGVGSDCIGLLVIVADALGLPEASSWRHDPRFKGYGRTPEPRLLLAACAAYLDSISISSARLGDILVFAFVRDPSRQPMHFGILSCASPRRVIHAYERVGRVVENGADASFWRAIAAFRLRGVEI